MGIFFVLKRYRSFCNSISQSSHHFITKEPQTIPKLNHILVTFQKEIWIALGLTIIIIALVFKLIHYVYMKSMLKKYDFARPVTHEIDFVILTVRTLTEPDRLTWFDKKSAGKFKILYTFNAKEGENGFPGINMASLYMRSLILFYKYNL